MSHIKNGPGKFDLMLALFCPRTDQREVTFALEGDKAVRCIVTGVEMEDGSGESWIVTGSISGARARFEAYFRTDRRTGTFRETDR